MLVLLLVCAALLYLVVIMGDGSGGGEGVRRRPPPVGGMPQPRLSLSVEALGQASYYFNAPLMTLEDGCGWRLEGVYISDFTPEGMDSTVREVRLRYTNEAGAAVDVSSLTPSRYLRALPERGFLTATDQSWELAGRRAVLMQSGGTLHLPYSKRRNGLSNRGRGGRRRAAQRGRGGHGLGVKARPAVRPLPPSPDGWPNAWTDRRGRAPPGRAFAPRHGPPFMVAPSPRRSAVAGADRRARHRPAPRPRPGPPPGSSPCIPSQRQARPYPPALLPAQARAAVRAVWMRLSYPFLLSAVACAGTPASMPAQGLACARGGKSLQSVHRK